MVNINPRELKKRLDEGNCPILIDVREDWEYEVCHLEGSRHIPMSIIQEKVTELDRAAETVVICHHGMRSLQVGYYLENIGFEKIINLDGGLDAWARTIDPEMPQY